MDAKEQILERLQEPYETLSIEFLKAAKEAAAHDPEVAKALRECRAFSTLSDSAIFGEPRTSDADFVVTLRNRLSSDFAPTVKAIFATGRKFAWASASCVALLAVILFFGKPTIKTTPEETVPLVSVADALDRGMTINWDSLDTESVDPDSFASYLGVSEFAAQWDFDGETGEPVTDALLELDVQSIEEVLNKLESTNFF